MRQKNFSIIELPDHQVLLAKDYDEGSDTYGLAVIFFINDNRVEQRAGYKDETIRDAAFNTFNHENAQAIVDSSIKLFS